MGGPDMSNNSKKILLWNTHGTMYLSVGFVYHHTIYNYVYQQPDLDVQSLLTEIPALCSLIKCTCVMFLNFTACKCSRPTTVISNWIYWIINQYSSSYQRSVLIDTRYIIKAARKWILQCTNLSYIMEMSSKAETNLCYCW